MDLLAVKDNVKRRILFHWDNRKLVSNSPFDVIFGDLNN